jgi:hypothetical protein
MSIFMWIRWWSVRLPRSLSNCLRRRPST